jgi:hypothetical protein
MRDYPEMQEIIDAQVAMTAPQDDRELWKTVQINPAYEVSNFGRVRRAGRILNGSITHDGYRQVTFTIYIGGKKFQKVHRVHNLVMAAFVGKRPEKFHICHGNGIKTDNSLENLRYAPQQENEADKFKHGTFANQHGPILHPKHRPEQRSSQ